MVGAPARNRGDPVRCRFLHSMTGASSRHLEEYVPGKRNNENASLGRAGLLPITAGPILASSVTHVVVMSRDKFDITMRFEELVEDEDSGIVEYDRSGRETGRLPEHRGLDRYGQRGDDQEKGSPGRVSGSEGADRAPAFLSLTPAPAFVRMSGVLPETGTQKQPGVRQRQEPRRRQRGNRRQTPSDLHRIGAD